MSAQLEKVITTLEKRLEAAKQLKEIEKDHPDLIDMLRQAPPKNGKVESFGVSLGKTHFERIKEYLISKNNVAHSAPEIIKATGLARAQISHVMYRTHKNDFEQVAIPGKRRKKWRLKNP